MRSRTTKLESLLEAVPDALVGMDQEGVIRFVNRQTEALFGYDRDQLIGRHIDILVPETLYVVYAQHREDYFTDPRTRSSGLDLELTARMRDGRDLSVNISMSSIDTGDVLLVITARRDVIKQRRAVEGAQLTAAIVEFSDDAIIGSTLEGVVTSWNPAAERMYGYPSQEIIGTYVGRLSLQHRASELKDCLARLKAGQAVERLETVRARRDGTVFPASITMAPIRDEDGAIVGVSVICRDVTEQRKALEAAQRMAAIVDSSHDAIISGSLDGIITSWNPAAEAMYGYSGREIVGKSIRLVIPSGRTLEIATILGRINEGQAVEDFETVRVRRDGTEFPVSLTISPIRDTGGAIVGTSAIHHDMTAYWGRLEIAQRLAAIVESSGDAIIGRRLDGTIMSWNPAAESMFGYSSAEMIGEPALCLIPPGRSDEIPAGLARIEAGQFAECSETRLVRKDGTVFPVSITVSPIRDENGAPVGASVILRDRTEQEHAAQYARSLIEAALDPLIMVGPDGSISDLNEAAVKIIGLSRDELSGSDFTQYVTEPDSASEVLRRVLAQESVVNAPLTVRHRNGSLTRVLCNASAYRDSAGNVLGVLAVARDVTEHLLRDEAVQEVASMVEFIDEAIIGTTLDGVVTSWNPAATRMHGYSADEVLGRSIGFVIPDDRADEVAAILARVSAGQVVRGLETVRLRKDGTVFPVLITVAPVRDPGGAIVGSTAIGRERN